MARGDWRVHAKILRAQQTLLLSGDGGKIDGVRRAEPRLRKSAGQLEKDSAAGAVVGGAVVDVVALGSGSMPR